MTDYVTSSGVVEGAYGGRRTNAGAPSNGTSEVQTITIGGTPTAGSLQVGLDGGTLSAAINWTATDATLISDIQTALDGLLGAGNTLVAAGTLSSGIGTITVTYQGDLAALNVPQLQVVSALTGSSPTLAISTTTAGVTATHRGAPAGTECQDMTNGDVYINQGTAVAPDWAKVTTA